MTGGFSPTLIETRRGLRSSGLGILTSRTLRSKWAWMPSGSMPSGRGERSGEAPSDALDPVAAVLLSVVLDLAPA
jgi:hypothetical protein